jgi:dUTP pyrophosphatase
MQVKIKKLHPDAKTPQYAKDGDAAVDLACVSKEYKPGQIVYGTGLAFEIPPGHVGLLFPRSSICKQDLVLSNSVGVLDSGYRGEVKFVFNTKRFEASTCSQYEIGERIGQLMIVPYPSIEFVESEDLSDTERGEGGFGSSGK